MLLINDIFIFLQILPLKFLYRSETFSRWGSAQHFAENRWILMMGRVGNGFFGAGLTQARLWL
ncbi:MAG: hypothetical protein R6U55_05900 [Desulfovermiculus sp.]